MLLAPAFDGRELERYVNSVAHGDTSQRHPLGRMRGNMATGTCRTRLRRCSWSPITLPPEGGFPSPTLRFPSRRGGQGEGK